VLISIIIPTCNRNDLLAKCLDCLSPENQQIDKSIYEIIVSDDGSKNQAKDLIAKKYPLVQWVEGPKKGPAANRNNGSKYASGDWLLFTDDDCLPDKYWLSEYIKAISNYKFLVFEGLTQADRPQNRFDEESPINLYGGNLWSCNFCILKSYFFKLKGFDDKFPHAAMEDIDLMTRIIKVEKIKFLKSAIVIHPWRRVNSKKDFIKHLSSHKYFLKKHPVESKHLFRLSRIKIFFSNLVNNTYNLFRFYMRGIIVFLERTILDFLIIFIS
jgi:GT2 family glycosyltransferase